MFSQNRNFTNLKDLISNKYGVKPNIQQTRVDKYSAVLKNIISGSRPQSRSTSRQSHRHQIKQTPQNSSFLDASQLGTSNISDNKKQDVKIVKISLNKLEEQIQKHLMQNTCYVKEIPKQKNYQQPLEIKQQNKQPPPPQFTIMKQLPQSRPQSKESNSRNPSAQSFQNIQERDPSPITNRSIVQKDTVLQNKRNSSNQQQYSGRQRDTGDVSLQQQNNFISDISKSIHIQPKDDEKEKQTQILQQKILVQQQNNSQFKELMQLIKKQEVQDKKFAVNDSDNEEPVKINCNFSKINFVFHYVIGKGGFGKVWKVEMKKNRQTYAMKEMGKSKIIAKRSVHSVMNEKELLQQLDHPQGGGIKYIFSLPTVSQLT